MPGARSSTALEAVGNDKAGMLRHDLVTPINVIIGYCDLLLSDAAEQNDPSRLAPLRWVRSRGFVLLNLVDQTLLGDRPDRSVADLARLASALNDPAVDVIRTCDALLTSAEIDRNPSDFAADVDKIRSSALYLIELTLDFAEGRSSGDQ